MSPRFFTRFLLISGFFFLVLSAQGAASPKNFIYRIRITEVTDTTGFTAINQQLKTIFDSEIRFNDVIDEIIVHSDMNVSKEKLSMQLTQAGYVLKFYRQVFIRSGN